MRSFMAHHQGMGLLSLDYLLRDQPMQRRFVADTEFQATLLLLQERIPRIGVFHPHAVEASRPALDTAQTRPPARPPHPGSARPAVQLLSNGRYHGMLTHAGGGYSRCGDLAVTRWREDGTRDAWGTFCYLRDVDSGEFWSAAYQPTCVALEGYEAIFSDAKAEFRGRSAASRPIPRSPSRPRTTSSCAACTSPTARAAAHDRDHHLCRSRAGAGMRRRAASGLQQPVRADRDAARQAGHPLHAPAALARRDSRRGCSIWSRCTMPRAMRSPTKPTARASSAAATPARARRRLTGDAALSGRAGSVLDPIVAIRCRIMLAPDQSPRRHGHWRRRRPRGVRRLIDKYRDRRLADRVFDLAWTHSQVVRRQINASAGRCPAVRAPGRPVMYAQPAAARGPASCCRTSADNPGCGAMPSPATCRSCCCRSADAANIELVRQLVQAHAYWRLKGLTVDLVIWNEDQAGYRQQLQDQIMGLVAAGVEAHVSIAPAAFSCGRRSRCRTRTAFCCSRWRARSSATRTARWRSRCGAAAAVVRCDAAPTRWRCRDPADAVADCGATHPAACDRRSPTRRAVRPWRLAFDNGLGGFTADGREYVIDVARRRRRRRHPGSNVLANPGFGTVSAKARRATPGARMRTNSA